MRIILRETNYKEVEVDDDISLEEISDVVSTGQIVIGDTMDAEYHVSFDKGNTWKII